MKSGQSLGARRKAFVVIKEDQEKCGVSLEGNQGDLVTQDMEKDGVLNDFLHLSLQLCSSGVSCGISTVEHLCG